MPFFFHYGCLLGGCRKIELSQPIFFLQTKVEMFQYHKYRKEMTKFEVLGSNQF